jgi:TolA-binding protein
MTVIDAGDALAPSEPTTSAPASDERRQVDEPATAEPPRESPSGAASEHPTGWDFATSHAKSVRDSWPKLVANGEFDLVVELANARGLDACLRTCAASDLRALADAARYTSRGDVAERALTTLRQRFAGSGESRAASFLLGRLAENRGSARAAEGWYETYLAEAPSGGFAAEALAGKMRTIQATRGRAAAEPVARDYLSRYPEGVHAKPARRILGEE